MKESPPVPTGNQAWPRAFGAMPPQLTRREREVVTLVSEGKTNLEIARLLFIEESTVKHHLYNVYQKFGFSAESTYTVRVKLAVAFKEGEI